MRKRVPALLEGCTTAWAAQRAWTAESLLMEREGNSLWVSESRRHSGNDEQQVGVALVKGTGSRDAYLFLMGLWYFIWCTFCICAAGSYRFLLLCCWQKWKSMLSLLVLNYLPIFRMLSVNLKMFWSRLWSCKIIPKADSSTKFWRNFPAANKRADIGEHRPITKKGILRRV